MTMSNPGYGGLPSAQELEVLANSLFPDLEQSGIQNAAGGQSTAGGRSTAIGQSTVGEQNAAIGQRTVGEQSTAIGQSTAIEQSTADWQNAGGVVNADGTMLPDSSGRPGCQAVAAWQELTGYDFSGSQLDSYWGDLLHPDGAQNYIPPEGETIRSYAPHVYSKQEGQQADRRVDTPTSLGGDRVNKGSRNTLPVNTRDSGIIIGSKSLQQIREDFPILQETINGNPLVWLDNGATTQRPRAVIDRLTYYYEHENSNVHRGAHELAARSTDAYEKARQTVATFIGAPNKDNIIFVRGTTEAINLVAHSYVKPLLQPGDEIILTILEHHANIVPWQLVAEETGAVIKVVPVDESGQLLLSEYERLFTKRTKFVSATQVSNVLGTVTPVEELVAIAHRHSVRILIDGAQSVAHIPVNVSAMDADFFVFSGHKIFAPTGIGALYGKKELLETARPYHGGGNMIADVTFERTIYNPAPNKFEAGTGSIADAVGLGAALEYLNGIGMPAVNQWEHELLRYAMQEMRKVKGLHLIGTAPQKASVLSFKLDGYSDEEVGQRLNQYGIAVRTGHHCAQPVLRRFGLEGTVRPTLALYNSPEDVEALVKVLRTFA